MAAFRSERGVQDRGKRLPLRIKALLASGTTVLFPGPVSPSFPSQKCRWCHHRRLAPLPPPPPRPVIVLPHTRLPTLTTMVSTAPDTMPVLYHVDCTWVSACVVQLAEELGLGPDRLCVRTITYEELQADAALAAINPIKRLPALLLPSGTVVVESGAIVSLLLSMHANDKRAQALLPPLDAPDDAHARALMFLHYAPASAYPLMRDTFLGTYGKRPEERDSAGLAATAATWAATVAALVGAALADGRAFLLGDTFTVADLMCTYEFLMVRWAGMDSDAVSGGDPRVAAWVDRLAERPSAVKVYAGLASMSINDGAAAA